MIHSCHFERYFHEIFHSYINRFGDNAASTEREKAGHQKTKCANHK